MDLFGNVMAGIIIAVWVVFWIDPKTLGKKVGQIVKAYKDYTDEQA